jgi:hypothetical protein
MRVFPSFASVVVVSGTKIESVLMKRYMGGGAIQHCTPCVTIQSASGEKANISGDGASAVG